MKYKKGDIVYTLKSDNSQILFYEIADGWDKQDFYTDIYISTCDVVLFEQELFSNLKEVYDYLDKIGENQ